MTDAANRHLHAEPALRLLPHALCASLVALALALGFAASQLAPTALGLQQPSSAIEAPAPNSSPAEASAAASGPCWSTCSTAACSSSPTAAALAGQPAPASLAPGELAFGSAVPDQQPAGSALGGAHSPASLSTRAANAASSVAYVRLEKAIAAAQRSVDFEREGLRVTLAEFDSAREALDERPEYSGFVSGWSWSHYTSGPLAGCMARVEIGYRATAAQVQEILAGLPQGVARALTWVSDDMTPLQKAQALHDYLVRTVAYDQRASSNTEPASSHNPYGALCLGTAVCEGYARAYQLLLEQVGVSCAYVASESMGHGWNMVELGGAWYHVDVTWDDPSINGRDDGFGASVSHAYFLKSDSYMRDHEHYGWGAAHSAPSSYRLGTLPVYSGPASGEQGPALLEQLIGAPKARSFTLKASALKTRARSLAGWGCVAKTRLSYAKTGGSSRLSVNAKTGRVTVKKGTKRGTYKIRLKVSAAQTSVYKAATERYTLTVRVV